MAGTVTIVDPPPAPNNTGRVLPGNLLVRCEVEALDGVTSANRVMGRSFMPSEVVPSQPPSNAQSFTNSPAGSKTWIATNLPSAAVGANNVVKVWAYFASAPQTPVSAERNYTGQS